MLASNRATCASLNRQSDATHLSAESARRSLPRRAWCGCVNLTFGVVARARHRAAISSFRASLKRRCPFHFSLRCGSRKRKHGIGPYNNRNVPEWPYNRSALREGLWSVRVPAASGEGRMKAEELKFSLKSSFCFIFVFLCLLTGCFRDPNARKQKYLDSGTRYFQQGKYPEAAIQFGNVLQIDKNFAAAHYQLARCFLRQSLFSNAFRELSIVVDLEPKNWQAQLDLANLLFEGRRFLDARDRATLILNENPTDVGAQLLLANSNAQLGNTQVAVEEAQHAVQMAPDKPAPYLTLGLLQEKAQQIPEGEQNLRKAVLLDPKGLPARLGLASFYQRQHRLSEAAVEYSEAIEADRHTPVPPASLAALYLSSGKK